MKYYKAYDKRYRAVHGMGLRWTSDIKTPIVLDTLDKYCEKNGKVLEIGCGEGRDAKAVFDEGYNLCATDISDEAVEFCKSQMPKRAERFFVLDCINGKLDIKFDFIYSVAVLHMLTEDNDRAAFYKFIKEHLKDGGKALVLSMGDGEREFCTDPDKAYELKERECAGKTVKVASTTCRIVNFDTFEHEIRTAGFDIAEKGLTSCPPEFDSLLYAVIK